MAKDIVTNNDSSPAELIRMAVSGGADLEKLEKLLAIQEKWEANEARKAYHEAMARFKENPPLITKDKKNKQYNSDYTSIGNLVNTVNPELSKQSLSASWDIEQNGIIKVTCIMTHKYGHSERASAQAGADGSGSKNAIQQIKSTITYLKSVTFESICGLASSDANVDDDGNAVEPKIDETQVAYINKKLDEIKADRAKFLEYMKIEKVEDMAKKDYAKAMMAINASKAKKAEVKDDSK